MDCGIRVWNDGVRWRAGTCPIHKARAGDLFVVGDEGIRIELDDDAVVDDIGFPFMSSRVSSERPKGPDDRRGGRGHAPLAA